MHACMDLKFSGWMYDYGEYTPSDSYTWNGTVGRSVV